MGVLVVDKPVGPSSFAVVKAVRRALLRMTKAAHRKDLKIGHGGTLDPLASGVLPICLGEATKLAPFLLDADKEYEAELKLGAETDTQDAQGRVVTEALVPTLDEQVVSAVLARFVGEQDQVPPMYSALKRDGRPLYSYARAGETVERASRRITVFSLTLTSFAAPDMVAFRVRCSKGTYVRSLAVDAARALGTVGHLTGLRRTISGPFRIEHAISLHEVERRASEGRPLPFVSLADALPHLPLVSVRAEVASALRRGKKVLWSDLDAPGPRDGPARLVDPGGTLIAVAAPATDDVVATLRVFNDDVLLTSGASKSDVGIDV